MSSQVVIALLGAGGFSAIIAAIVTGLFSKRKLGAEATEIITKAAAGVVTNLQAEVDRQAKRAADLLIEHQAEMQRLVSRHQAEMDEVRRVLQLHVAWDAIAIARLGDLGVTLPPAPPLLPDARLRDDDH